MKRIISVFLALLSVFLIFSVGGCSPDRDAAPVTTGGTGEMLDMNGYSIIRPFGDDSVSKLGTVLFKTVKEKSEIKLKNSDDSEKPLDKEILIGNTSRDESAEAKELLHENGGIHSTDYIIKVYDSKIAVYGASVNALENAVNELAEMIIANRVEKGSVTLKIVTDFPEVSIDGTHISEFTVVVPQYNRSYYVVRKIDELNDFLDEHAGVVLTTVEDNCDAKAHEIIIGDCDREGVKAVPDTESYTIKAQNGNLYINGGRNYSVAYAIDKLIELIKKNGKLVGSDISGNYINGEKKGDYKLVFSDEFDTFNKNTWSAWNINHGTKPRTKGYGSWFGMNTARSTAPENLRCEDGKLYMTATFDDKTYYGARMDTEKSLQFTKGYMEISARIADGDGVWVDFWTWSSAEDHLEMDIMECPGPGDFYDTNLHEFIRSSGRNINDQTGVTVSRDGVHSKGDYWTQRGGYNKANSLNNEFHTYGCEWTDTYMSFYRDGEETMRRDFGGTDRAYLYEQPHYFILSMLVGSNYENLTTVQQSDNTKYHKYPDKTLDFWNDDRASFIIEYLQLFQKDGQYLKMK